MSHDGFKCLKCGYSTPEWGEITCPKCGYCYLTDENIDVKFDEGDEYLKGGRG
jgi:hypothetical protein